MLGVVSISPLWYISRSAGFVGLVLLGIIGILGVITAGNLNFRRGARFMAPEIHRSLSLLALVVLAIHVGAAVLDKYSHIGLKDVFIPFMAQYRPIWVGLGAIAIDLGLAVVITSLLRVKMGYKSWKLVHWASYPIFGLSIIHGLGTGSDSSMLFAKVIYLLIGLSLVAAILIRLLSSKEQIASRRFILFGTSFAVPLLIISWAFVGPFTPTWPHRAQGGLSQAVNRSGSVAAISGVKGSSASTTSTIPKLQISSGYSSGWSGQLDESPANSQGEIALRLFGPLTASPAYKLSIVLIGFPQDGGVSMASSIVEVAADNGSVLYKGSVTSLNGTTIVCALSGISGNAVTITTALNLSNSGASFNGTVTAS